MLPPPDAPRPGNEPSRAYVFTWNNYPESAYDDLSVLRPHILVMNIGKEVSASGTPHLQGHFILKKATRLTAVRRLFPAGIHFEVRRGTEAQAKAYTEKEGNPDRLDWDDRHQGSRTDLAAVSAIVKAHPRTAIHAVASSMPETYVKYHAGIRALQSALLPPWDPRTKRVCKWYYGPTNTGKTYTAVTEAHASSGDPSNVFVWSNQNFKFADGYSGQQYVVIDELRPTWREFSYARLLTLLDNYPTTVEVKGSSFPWLATHVWITAPVHPDPICPHEEICFNANAFLQLRRRLSVIQLFDVPYVEADAPAPSLPAAPPPAGEHICPDSAPPSRAATPPGTPRLVPFGRRADSSDDEFIAPRPAARLAGILPVAATHRLPARVSACPPPMVSLTDSDSDH